MASAKDVTVVLGAAGATGLECVKRLIELKGPGIIRAVARDPAKLEAVGLSPNEHLQIVRGDVTDIASLREVLAGARGVIFAAAGKGYWSPAEVDFKVRATCRQLHRLASSMGLGRRCFRRPANMLLALQPRAVSGVPRLYGYLKGQCPSMHVPLLPRGVAKEPRGVTGVHARQATLSYST